MLWVGALSAGTFNAQNFTECVQLLFSLSCHFVPLSSALRLGAPSSEVIRLKPTFFF